MMCACVAKTLQHAIFAHNAARPEVAAVLKRPSESPNFQNKQTCRAVAFVMESDLLAFENQRAHGGAISARSVYRVFSRVKRMRRKVLIVDDDAYSSTQLRKLLDSEELSVEAVASGQEALTAMASNDYSVLITDLRMPGMGGMDLIREVANRRLLVTPIVTTAFGSIDRVVEAMRLGAYDFLTKPIDPTYLKLVMDRALKKRALQDEVLNTHDLASTYVNRGVLYLATAHWADAQRDFERAGALPGPAVTYAFTAPGADSSA